MYSYKDIQEIREHYKLREMYHQLFIIVAIVVGFAIGLLY